MFTALFLRILRRRLEKGGRRVGLDNWMGTVVLRKTVAKSVVALILVTEFERARKFLGQRVLKQVIQVTVIITSHGRYLLEDFARNV